MRKPWSRFTRKVSRKLREIRYSKHPSAWIPSRARCSSDGCRIAAALSKVNGFLQRIKANAEQLSPRARWRLILSAAFQYFLRGKVLGGTGRLAQATV